jgi:hypothetical protein
MKVNKSFELQELGALIDIHSQQQTRTVRRKCSVEIIDAVSNNQDSFRISNAFKSYKLAKSKINLLVRKQNRPKSRSIILFLLNEW